MGDINLGRGVQPQLDSFSCIQTDLSTADLALANLESPLGNDPATDLTGYNLCAPLERLSLLDSWGIDLLSLANNHAQDCSPAGSEETASTLASAGLTALSPQPVRLEVNSLSLAFFAFDDVSAYLDVEAAAEAVRLAKEDGALVIVSLHWGWEYEGAPSARQEELAARLADAGAVLIWGHHPHVLQPARWLETKWGRTLVLFSLGNALFDQGGMEDTRQSALLLVTLDAGGVTQVEAIPFLIDVPHSRLLLPDAETTQEILSHLAIP